MRLISDLTNLTVLEIHSGKGENTRQLAGVMAGHGGRLMVNDISDEHFPAIQADLSSFDLDVSFVRSSAVKLAGIRLSSIDLVICSFTLNEINAIAGQGELALHKFYEVLKPGGQIYLEEELPCSMAASPSQAIWASGRQWMKAAQALSANRQANEFQPDVLESLVSMVGFEDVTVSDEIKTETARDWWEGLNTRMEPYKKQIPSEVIRNELDQSMQALKEKADADKQMDIPFVIITARKPWRFE